MTDPDAVKRALSRLAAGVPPAAVPRKSGSDGDGGGSASHEERVVAEATAAVADLDRAASFRQDGGVVRLRRAIEGAKRAGDRRLVRRGQRVLAAYERFRYAATAAETPDAGRPTDWADERPASPRSGGPFPKRRSRNH